MIELGLAITLYIYNVFANQFKISLADVKDNIIVVANLKKVE